MTTELGEKGLFNREGALLKIGASEGFDPEGASYDGAMAATNVIFTEWILIPQNVTRIAFENLWSGDPDGALSVEVSLKGPAEDAGLDITANDPDGTSYAGDLTAGDLRSETLGVSDINISGLSVAAIRMKYTNASGAGTWNSRVRGMEV